MSKVKVEDVYDPETMLNGIAVIFSWTLFLPLRFIAWAAKRSSHE